MKKDERISRVYVGFVDLEQVYNRVNRKYLWDVQRMYDACGKLLFEDYVC